MLTSVVKLLQRSKRPLFIWGAGMRAYRGEAFLLANTLGIPVATTWGAIDLMHHDWKLNCGGFGTHGTRAANFAVQNADCIISLGCRLDTKATGDVGHFARAAKIVMVDIDRNEIDKFEKLGRAIDIPICMDVGEFIDQLGDLFGMNEDMGLRQSYAIFPCNPWKAKIAEWKRRYADPVVTWPGVNPYELMKEIAKHTTADDIIVSDTGNTIGYICQGFPFKGERMIHAWNMTPMGYGLPASIGSSFATGKRVILVTGDGSIMMSLSELATIARWNLNIKIILLNNQGHGMCRQTQRQWLGGKYYSTSVEGGLGFPDFANVVQGFGIEPWGDIRGSLNYNLENFFTFIGPLFMEVEIHPDAHLTPQCKFGQPLEDADPQLPREEFREQMLIDTLETA